MTELQLVKAIEAIAAANPTGFTVTVPDLEPVTAGWCIGHKDTQNCFGRKGLKKVVAHALETTRVVGGWRGYDKRFYFDTVIITHNINEAFDLKYDNQQQAIYQIETGRVL